MNKALTQSVCLPSDPQEQQLFELADQLGQLLAAKGLRFSCAESCTGGGIAYAITSVAGSSAWFDKSWVTYANEAKQIELGVDAATLDSFGAVSAQTAEQMVRGVQQQSNAQVAVSVTGIAGPGGGSVDKPVGLVWFGFYIDGAEQIVAQQFVGDRSQVRRQAIAFVLANLIEQLVA
ncbi:MAG: CinA family protein [Alteromonas sp.]